MGALTKTPPRARTKSRSATRATRTASRLTPPPPPRAKPLPTPSEPLNWDNIFIKPEDARPLTEDEADAYLAGILAIAGSHKLSPMFKNTDDYMRFSRGEVWP
ncbi:MAG: hypothetical protein LBR07_06760 [Puniceicoccales bacterium]|jgi:hypothetical protein|nr:hypothetical protein [Puniceicoccales bacterium]